MGATRRHRIRLAAAVLLLAVAVGSLTAARETATAAPDGNAPRALGRLDTSFGQAGIVRTSFGPRAGGGVRELLVDASDRIVAVGYLAADEEAALSGSPARDVALVRYLASGALDRTFGKNGKVILDVRGLDEVATDAAQQRDGRIVVVGATDSVPASDRQDLLLLRFRGDGALDRTFGENGLVVADLSSATPDLDCGFGVAIQADGKIVAVGQASLVGTNRMALAVARFLPDGRPDAAFGTRGVVRATTGPPRIGQAMLVQADGRILVGGDGGTSSDPAFVARLDPRGRFDASFGKAGFVRLPRGAVRAVLSADGGATLALGGSSVKRSSAFIVKLDRRGRVDRSFGAKGRVDVPVAPNLFAVGALSGVAQPDGKIVLAGANGYDMLVARYSSNGQPDRDFGGTGVVTIDVDGRFDFASAVTLGRGGKIVAAGDSSRSLLHERSESVLVRLIGAGSARTRYASTTAVNLAAGVAIRWQTLAEPDVREYVVFRSHVEGATTFRKRLTATPIRARRHPARYTYLDRYPPDFAPMYWLEEVRRDGTRALFGPIIPG